MNKAEKPVKGCPTDLKKETLHIENGECGLQDGRHFLDQVFNGIGDGISILDIDLNIIRVNKAITGWYPHIKNNMGKKCYEIYQGRSRPCDPCPTLNAIKSKQLEPDRILHQGTLGGRIQPQHLPGLHEKAPP
jgi:hypothetical protein